ACPEALARGVPGITYDTPRCQVPRELHARGVTPEGAFGFSLYRFLGRRYQVVYVLEGQLAISPARMAFLFDDLPLAARLLAHFQKVPYSAQYVDAEHHRFKGERGNGQRGEADLFSGST